MLTTERFISCNECNTTFKPEIDTNNTNFPEKVYCPNCRKEVNFRDAISSNSEEALSLGFVIVMIFVALFGIYVVLMMLVELIN